MSAFKMHLTICNLIRTRPITKKNKKKIFYWDVHSPWIIIMRFTKWPFAKFILFLCWNFCTYANRPNSTNYVNACIKEHSWWFNRKFIRNRLKCKISFVIFKIQVHKRIWKKRISIFQSCGFCSQFFFCDEIRNV